MRSWRRSIPAVLLGALALTACQLPTSRSEDSPFFVVPAGSTLLLRRALPVQADRASLYIQGGEVRPYAAVDQYRPYCKLELQALSTSPREILPERFRITRAWQEVRVSMVAPGPVAQRRVVHNDSGGTPHRVYATVMELSSPRQPLVRTLTCQHWDDPPTAQHLTIAQIRGALGTIAELRLAAPGG